MDEKAWNHNEGQYKRLGMKEAFSADVREQMQAGVPLIEQRYTKPYPDDGNQANVTIYAKRATDTPYYYINKFEVEVRFGDKEDLPKQTFYVNRKPVQDTEGQSQLKEERYTLKQAYNLLCGRPVFSTFINKQGEEYTAWSQLNFRNKLPNGNFEINQYGGKYGFDLDKVLKAYSLKVLANPDYTQSLKEDLYRGNLQKTTFVHPDGQQVEYYISPHIKTGSLSIWDLDKKGVSLDKQQELGLITEGHAQHLKAFFTRQQQTAQAAASQVKPEGSTAQQPEAQKQSTRQSTKQKPKQTRKRKTT